jgi:putative flippase GtrA
MAVLIPSYEPTERLAEVVRGLRTLDPSIHVLVVDDGSGPSYAARFDAARAAGAEVVHLSRNRGKGAALKIGLYRLLATRPGEDVVTADSDGQHTPADILAVAAATHGQDSLVLGCRGFTGSVPVASRFGNAVSRWLFHRAAGFGVSDTQTGLRGLPAGLVGWASTVPGDRFEYEQNMLLRCSGEGVTVREVPIETVYFDHNSGTHFRPVADSVRVLLPVLLFAGSSLAAFAVDTVVFAVLHGLTGWIAGSIVGARLMSAGVNFVLNGAVVFRSPGGHLERRVAGYALLALALLGGSIAGTTWLAGLGLPALVAKILTESVLFLVSYQVQRRVIFARPEPAAPAPQPKQLVGAN